MKKHLLLMGLSALVILSSCKKDEEPAPPHEVGIWELDSYVLQNFPSAFSSYEGAAYDIDQLSFGNGVTYQDYTIELKKDGKYNLNIGLTGPDLIDNGTWKLDGEDLTLKSDVDNDYDLDWGVVKNENDNLWLSLEFKNYLIPDIYYDTVSQDYKDYLDTLTSDQLDSIGNILFQEVTFDLVHVFQRQK